MCSHFKQILAYLALEGGFQPVYGVEQGRDIEYVVQTGSCPVPGDQHCQGFVKVHSSLVV